MTLRNWIGPLLQRRRTSKPRKSRRWMLVGAVLAGLVLQSDLRPAVAQTDSETRRQLIDQLIDSLIRSEQERRDNLQPTSFTQPQAAPGVEALNSNIQQVRRLLDDFAREAERLTYALDSDSLRVPEIRGFMSDVLKIKAAADILARRSARDGDLRSLITQFEEIDREWRVLAYRLGQVRGLSRPVLDSVERLNEYDKSLGQYMQLKPQLNRYDLIRQASSLIADLRNLLDDIEIELDRTETREDLLLTGRRVQQQAIQFSNTVVDRIEYDAVVSEYERFRNLWYPFAAKLRPYENRYLERSVRRIQSTDQQIHELLWMPQTIDRQQLLHVTNSLKNDVDQFFLRATLRVLITIPDAQYVLPTAGAFYGAVENFADSITLGEDHAALIEEYRYVEEYWLEFDAMFRQLNSDAALQVLTQIERSVADLRRMLQMPDTFNRDEAASLAASLENLATHLDYDLKTWLNSRRVEFRAQALQESQNFVTSCRRFHQMAVSNGNLEELRDEARRLFDSWQRVHGYVLRCDTREKEYLQVISSRITPVVVELQTRMAL